MSFCSGWTSGGEVNWERREWKEKWQRTRYLFCICIVLVIFFFSCLCPWCCSRRSRLFLCNVFNPPFSTDDTTYINEMCTIQSCATRCRPWSKSSAPTCSCQLHVRLGPWLLSTIVFSPIWLTPTCDPITCSCQLHVGLGPWLLSTIVFSPIWLTPTCDPIGGHG